MDDVPGAPTPRRCSPGREYQHCRKPYRDRAENTSKEEELDDAGPAASNVFLPLMLGCAGCAQMRILSSSTAPVRWHSVSGSLGVGSRR